jgi:TonB family protein
MFGDNHIFGRKLTNRLLAILLGAGSLCGFSALAEVRIPTSDAIKSAIKKPTPPYNPIAKQMRVAGDVEVEIVINKQGDVDTVKVLTGNALLSGPVLRTVKDWKFTPPSVESVTILRFTFKPE